MAASPELQRILAKALPQEELARLANLARLSNQHEARVKETGIGVSRVARVHLHDEASRFLAAVVCPKVLASILRVVAKALIDTEAEINIIFKEVAA